ncbi:Anti-sigma-28 factor FlgM family protein [Oleidesulfovibrio alaskensis G20]|jgi:negative regulator of flagellin synthesis FlgM|uniref:Negative regulator of flagellin synthesis n=1 Tax=Oleidesulfovibrio alaskensis (strain ATCC BAA-1058 / DSM 17464 / G20) TaxID=207559 RepID=Q315F7_OLEA2|nr:flagellar biosynthesis anti-sigma factor FlgM [Oleidesulfovibrio alaskensis]ABB37439.1 Anti-sigma-28 factor FlgM family protein [Oleidesulfovibrio alaskensis G20]MBG0774475.1 flagellar biosynthesis anti-sigma factor FlgM [Oleidesulfovibrio alaskensis]MBL3580816.1 flagellar biosynthesis anti-sigma factor FlgM [Oleidesulfovibrio alaskensis]
MQIKNLLNKLDPYQAKLEKADSKNTGDARRKSGDSSSGGDRVSLSNDARLRTEAYTGALSTPEIRHEKVAEIKDRIASGEYRIDSKDIARKLLRDETDFLA